jgi:hypothetical protein
MKISGGLQRCAVDRIIMRAGGSSPVTSIPSGRSRKSSA